MENANSKAYKRSNYFIDKDFQTKFILKFSLLVIGGGLLTIGVLYFLAMRSTSVSIVNSRVVVRTTADFILPVLIQTVAVVTILIGLAAAGVTLLVSHKIAGPLYRFKKVMEELEGGNLASEFRIRHLDQLQNLAGAFNSMIRKTRAEVNSMKENFISLKEKLDSISDQEISEHKRAALSELKKISGELNKIIQHFKT